MKRVYLDHAATTPVKPQVLEAMLPYFTERFGNASSLYAHGREAHAALDHARSQVARALNADEKEIIFTAGGSEADNMAIFGAARALGGRGKHLITSAIEHHAVLHCMETLAEQGFSVTHLPVDEFGRVRVEDLRAAMREDTILVSIMFANNEIGTIQPVAEIGALCREKGVWFHCDAVQAVGSVPIDVKAMNIDMLSLSAHKFYGPKGVGALYMRKGLRIPPFIYGGAQERKRRAGTENVPGIVGLGAAIELATADIPGKAARITALRDALAGGIMARIEGAHLNGHPTERLPNNVNLRFDYIEGEGILTSLDLKGIEVSSGSACSAGSSEPSHVLMALGLAHEQAHGSVRMTLGDGNTREEIDVVVEELASIIKRLREMSPLFAQAKGGKSYV